MTYKKTTIETLLKLMDDNRSNDRIKLMAIHTLGSMRTIIYHAEAMNKLLNLCNSQNGDIAIAAMKALSQIEKNSY